MHANGNAISVPDYTLNLAITNLYLYSKGDPEGVTGIFHWLNPSIRIVALESI
jgi:hypothetical protein